MGIDAALGGGETKAPPKLYGDVKVLAFPVTPTLPQTSLAEKSTLGLPRLPYCVRSSTVRFAAGAVVPPGDVEAMSRALEHLLQDREALTAARLGAERAREELTWDASAAGP